MSLIYRNTYEERQYAEWLYIHTDEYSRYACLAGDFKHLNVYDRIKEIVQELGGEYLRHEDSSIDVRWPK